MKDRQPPFFTPRDLWDQFQPTRKPGSKADTAKAKGTTEIVIRPEHEERDRRRSKSPLY